MIRRGANTIIVVGYYYAQPLASVAARHPDVRFTLIDASVPAPNVRSVLFREQEGTFLTGVLAAMASRTGTTGFVGAMDIPLIRKFIGGFDAGARFTDPAAKLLVHLVWTTHAPFTDPLTAAQPPRSPVRPCADCSLPRARTP